MAKTSWPVKNLGDICEIYQPQTIGLKDMVPDGPYVVYGANGPIGRYDRFNHEKSEVTVTCRGATCGTVNVTPPQVWITGNAMVVRPNEAEMSKLLLKYWLEGLDYSSVITGTAQPQITRTTLSPMKISVPPLGEQKRIVALLDAATARVTELTACYEQARTHANNLFTSALSSALEDNPDWQVKTLGEICELQRGHDLPTPERREGEVPILGSTGVTGFHNVARYEGPGVAIGRSGFIGGAQYCDVSYWPLNTCLFVKNFFGNKPRWVYYVLKNIDFSQYNSGTTQPSLNRNNLSHIPVSTPSLGAQQEIVARLELMVAKTSEMVAAYDAKLTAAKNLRQSILEAAFAGDL